MAFQKVRWENWIGLAHDLDPWQTLVNAVTNLLVPLNAWNFLSILETAGFSARAPLYGFI